MTWLNRSSSILTGLPGSLVSGCLNVFAGSETQVFPGQSLGILDLIEVLEQEASGTTNKP